MAQIFWKFLTPKNKLPWMAKRSCFRTSFESQSVCGFQTLLKSGRNRFYPDFPLIQDELSLKRSFWIRSKMERLFVNTLTVDPVYSPHRWEEFPKAVQRQLSWKPRKSSHIFVAFLKSTWNFAHFEKKDQLDGSNILELINSEKCASLNAKKVLFQNTLRESKCSRVPHTSQVCTESFLC